MVVRHKNQHEWGLVYQCKNPYREFHYCPLCKKYKESGASGYMTGKQFDKLAESLMFINSMYIADSANLKGMRP